MSDEDLTGSSRDMHLTSQSSREVPADGQVGRSRLNLLLIEDSVDDATLVTRTLARAGYEVAAVRVETAEALREALTSRSWARPSTR